MSHRRIILSFNENEINGPKPHCPRFYFFFWKLDFSWQTLLVICQWYFEEIKSRNQVCFLLHIIPSWIFIGKQEHSNCICGDDPTSLFPFPFHFAFLNYYFTLLLSENFTDLSLIIFDFHWLPVEKKCNDKRILFSIFFHLLSLSTGMWCYLGHIFTHRGVKKAFLKIFSCLKCSAVIHNLEI